MFSLLLNCSQDEKDLLIAELWESGVAGIVETPTALRAFFEDGIDRDMLSARFYPVAIEEAEDRDWVAESRELLQPMAVGRLLYLVPEWRDDPAPEGRIRIRIDSGMAFGTGAHESTRLCLRVLEELVLPGMTVVDVGTGSGILAEAAKQLGAGRVIACDLDPLAIEVARGNFQRAALEIELFEGSIQNIESGVAGLAIGNINPESLTLLAPEFARILRHDGAIVWSGLESQDVPRIAESLAAIGFPISRILAENEWRAVIARHSLAI